MVVVPFAAASSSMISWRKPLFGGLIDILISYFGTPVLYVVLAMRNIGFFFRSVVRGGTVSSPEGARRWGEGPMIW